MLALTIAIIAVGFSSMSQAADVVAAPTSAAASVNHPVGEPCSPGPLHDGHGKVCMTAGNASFAIPTAFAEVFVPTIPILFAPWPDDRGSGATPMPRLHPPQLRLIA